MKVTPKGSHTPTRVQINFQAIRNLTSPDEKSNGIQTYFANVAVGEVLKLDTKDNLRSYIAEYNPKRRNGVHEAIRDTIDTSPDKFIVRNSGFTVTANDIDVDEGKKRITLTGASIINGAQSQGEIRRYFNEINDSDDDEEPSFHVRMEIIVDPDPRSVVDTAIARNTQSPVKSISQAGARGHLDELEQEVRKKFPKLSIRKNETDIGDDIIDTERLLQWTRLLMPESVSGNSSDAEKLRAYKNRQQCLSDFSTWFETKKTDPLAKTKYDFTVHMAPHAIREFKHWESHQAWNGQHIWEETKKGGRATRRDATGRIYWVAPGIIYPILGALSEFANKDAETGKWKLDRPSVFRENTMIKHAVRQFRSHESDPMAMGRSSAAYDALRTYTSTLMDAIRESEDEA